MGNACAIPCGECLRQRHSLCGINTVHPYGECVRHSLWGINTVHPCGECVRHSLWGINTVHHCGEFMGTGRPVH